MTTRFRQADKFDSLARLRRRLLVGMPQLSPENDIDAAEAIAGGT